MNTETLTPGLIDQSLDASPYTLSSPVEVLHVLRSLIKSSAMVAVYFNNGADFLVTTLLDVDVKAGTLIFDAGADTEINNKLLASSGGEFTASPEGIKIQFSGKKVSAAQWRGNPAFVMRLPERVVKLQRREFYRIQTPVINPLACTIKHAALGVVKLKLFDISIGGVGLVVSDAENYPLYEHYANCRLDLHDFGDLTLNVQSRNLVQIPLKAGKVMVRMGCKFIDLHARQEATLQRVIAQLERERNIMGGV